MNEQPEFENTFAATTPEDVGKISTSLDRLETDEERRIRLTKENNEKITKRALKKLRELLEEGDKDKDKKDPESPEEPKQ